MQFLKKSWPWLVAVVVLALVAVPLLGATIFSPKSARAATQTGQVSRGNIQSEVSSSASLEPAADLQLTFGAASTITAVNVKVGDQVQKGQVIAQIDTADLQLAVTQAQAGVSSAQAKLDALKAGSTAKDVQDAQDSLISAQAKLDSLKQGPASSDLANAQAGLASAQAKLNSVKAGSTPQDIANAQSALTSAQAKLDSLKQPATAQDIANAQSALTSAQAKLDALKQPAAPGDIAVAESNLKSAQAKLQSLKDGPTAAQLSAAKLKVSQAQSNLTKTQSSSSLAKQSAEISLNEAANAVRDAQDKLVEARTINTRHGSEPIIMADGSYNPNASQTQIDTYNAAVRAEQDAEANMHKAQLAYDDAKLSEIQDDQAAQQQLDDANKQLQDLTAGATPSDIAAAQASVDSAQNALDKLKQPPSQFDLEQAQAAVDQAKSNLDKLKQPPSQYDITQAQAAVDQAKNNLLKLQQPPADADIKAAEAGVASAQANLDKVKQPSTPYDITQAQAAVDQAKNNLDALKEGSSATDIEQAQAAVDQAKANLDSANLKLKNATLTAPFAGTVVDLPVTVGQSVTASTVVAEVMDVSSYHLDVNVSETDISTIKNGQNVDISFDALPDDVFTGTVTFVSPKATVTQGVTSYLATVTLDPKAAGDSGLRPGMSATAAVVTAQHTNVLLVPSRAVRTEGVQRVVYVVGPNNSQIRVPVQVGLTNGTSTEIMGDTPLREGDSLILNTTTTTSTTGGGGNGFGIFGGGGGGGFRAPGR